MSKASICFKTTSVFFLHVTPPFASFYRNVITQDFCAQCVTRQISGRGGGATRDAHLPPGNPSYIHSFLFMLLQDSCVFMCVLMQYCLVHLEPSIIDDLPDSGKFSTLRKQLKIDMAGEYVRLLTPVHGQVPVAYITEGLFFSSTRYNTDFQAQVLRINSQIDTHPEVYSRGGYTCIW